MQQADDVSSYAREDRPRIHGVRSLMSYSMHLSAFLMSSLSFTAFNAARIFCLRENWVTPDSDSSSGESAAADAHTGGKASPPPHGVSLTGGGVGGGRFAGRTVAVRSYPRVRSCPHLPYNFPLDFYAPGSWFTKVMPGLHSVGGVDY